jgi:REP element-mobilizing transposase RayT
VLEPGKHYHIFNRGNNRELIFRSEENYRYFLQKYREYVHPHVETYSYCLMPDHFHFVIRVKPCQKNAEPAERRRRLQKSPRLLKSSSASLSPISKAFKDFFISYAKSFNKRYHRTGSLFQYKFKRKEIEKEDYLIRLICYVHANPIAASLCARFEDWKYSSYNALVGRGSTGLNRGAVLEWFGGRENFIYVHEEFIRKGYDEEDEDFKSLRDF